jgi:RNA polymerase sigma-70 factor (ECF subfamily)
LAVVGGDGGAPAQPNCPDVLTMLSKKLEDEISPNLCAEMERHVDGCPHCKGLCDSLKRTLALCKSAPSPLVPRHVQESLRKAVQAALDEQR